MCVVCVECVVCEHKCTRTCECTCFINAGQVQEYSTVILFLFQKQAILAFVRLIACAVSVCATGACTKVQTYSVCHLLTLCYVQCNGVTCLYLTENHRIFLSLWHITQYVHNCWFFEPPACNVHYIPRYPVAIAMHLMLATLIRSFLNQKPIFF